MSENQYNDGVFIPDKVWSWSGMTIDLISTASRGSFLKPFNKLAARVFFFV